MQEAYGRGILQSRSHNCLIGSHECLLLFTPSCCCECLYHLYWLVCLYCYVVNAGVGMVVVSAGHVGGTRGSGIVTCYG